MFGGRTGTFQKFSIAPADSKAFSSKMRGGAARRTANMSFRKSCRAGLNICETLRWSLPHPGGTDVEMLFIWCFIWRFCFGIDGGPAAHVFDTFTVYWWSLSFSCRVPRLLMHHSEQHFALLFEGFNFLDIWGFAKMGVPPNHQF